MEYKNYGELLCNARKNKHISQGQLADKMGVSRQAVSNWENNKCYPDVSIIPKLCNVLDINIYDFFDNEKGLKILELEKEKVRKRNKLIVVFSIILILFISVFIVLVINNNQFTYYSLSIDENDSFKLNNAHFIETNDVYYLNLGSLETNIDSNIIVRIYEPVGNSKEVIYSSVFNREIILFEDKGYDEYFDDFNPLDNNLFIEFEYILEGKKVTVPYELNFDKVIYKKGLFSSKVDSIGNGVKSVGPYYRFDVDKMIDNDYVFNNNSGYYEKSVDGKDFNILSSSLDILFGDSMYSYYISYETTNNLIFITKYNNFENTIILDAYYDVNNDVLSYSVGNEDIKEYINLAIDEINKIATKI